MGQSVWGATGDITTNAKIDFSNAITGTNPYTIAGETGSMTWTRQWTYTPTISNDGYLLFGNMDSNPIGGAVVELQNANIGAKDKVTISFELAFSKLNGKHIGFQLLDANDNVLLNQLFDAYNGDFDDANPLNLDWSKMYHGSNEIIWDRRVYFTIEFDYAAKKVSTSTVCYLSGTDKAATEGTAEAAWTTTTPIAKFVLVGNLNQRPSALGNLEIKTTEGDYSVEDANYTVKYVCGEDEVKDAAVRSGEVNSSISLFSSDKESFTSGEQRYIYVEDDAESKTVSSDGKTVVTVTFRKANKYNYTVTSSYDSNPLTFGYSGSVWEDQNTISVNYPRYQVYNNTTLVGKKPNGNDLTQSATIDSNDKIVSVEYSALDTPINDLYLFTEAENIQGLNASYPSGLANRISNKGMATGTSGTLLNLPAGKYKVTVGLSGGAGNNFTVKVNAGEDEIISGVCTANTIQEFTSEEFTLAKSTDITFTNTVNNSGRGIDFIYVQKTGDPELISASITSYGYATFSSTNPVNVDVNGLEAYIVTDKNGNSIITEKITGNVAANTGLILKGSEGEYSLPVVASGTTYNQTSDPKNYLFACNGSSYSTVPAADEGTNYVLTVQNEKVVFAPIINTPASVKAGQAALWLPTNTSPAKALTLSFADDVTGINSVSTKEPQAGKIYYNLQGQRVSKPNHGIYMVEGKKVFVNKLSH